MSQRLTVKQIQTVSTRVIQTNMILQLTGSELETFLHKEAEENPVLELVEDDQYSYGHTDSEGTEEFWMDPGNEETLSDHLLAQVTRELTSRERRTLEYLCSLLDDNGYLKHDPAETAEKLGVSQKTVQEMTALIQSLEPAGVGTADMQECLCIQMERQGVEDPKLYRFVKEGLLLLAEGKTRILRESLGLSEEEISAYLSYVRTLEPRPGSAFRANDRSIYIVPDIYVERDEEGFKIRFNRRLFPGIRIREEYRTLYKSFAKEEKSYVREKMQRINLLQRSIEGREKLITGLGEYILERQQAFFMLGEGNLKSLRMQDAADALHVNVSSISRAVNGKYLECEWGTYPLKYFFTQGKQDQPVRTDIIRMIREIIAEEDKNAPLSDAKLTEILKAKGITCARRTVTKYRIRAGIGDTAVRKRR